MRFVPPNSLTPWPETFDAKLAGQAQSSERGREKSRPFLCSDKNMHNFVHSCTMLVQWDFRASQKGPFLLGKVARPERFELPTLWFEASCGQNPNGLFGVAYESRNVFQPAQ